MNNNFDSWIHSADALEATIDKTEWLDDASAEDLEEIHAQFSLRFAETLEKLQERLGTPSFTDSSAPEQAQQFYPEALKLAVWETAEKTLFLAYGQHDQETPVFLSFGKRC